MKVKVSCNKISSVFIVLLGLQMVRQFVVSEYNSVELEIVAKSVILFTAICYIYV